MNVTVFTRACGLALCLAMPVYAAEQDDDTTADKPVPDDRAWEPWPVNTARNLSRALRNNPDLRVLVASGWYDLVTPFFDAEYTLNRHDIDAARIDYRYYGGGHMMYVNEPSRTEFLADTRAFMRRQLER